MIKKLSLRLLGMALFASAGTAFYLNQHGLLFSPSGPTKDMVRPARFAVIGYRVTDVGGCFADKADLATFATRLLRSQNNRALKEAGSQFFSGKVFIYPDGTPMGAPEESVVRVSNTDGSSREMPVLYGLPQASKAVTDRFRVLGVKGGDACWIMHAGVAWRDSRTDDLIFVPMGITSQNELEKWHLLEGAKFNDLLN